MNEPLKATLVEAAELIGLGTVEVHEELAAAIEAGKLTNLHHSYVTEYNGSVSFCFQAAFGLDFGRSGRLEARVEAAAEGYSEPRVTVALNWCAGGAQAPASAIRLANSMKEAAELACAVEDVLRKLVRAGMCGPHAGEDLRALGKRLAAERQAVLAPKKPSKKTAKKRAKKVAKKPSKK